MLQQDHSLRVRLSFEDLGGELRQPEAGHHVGHDQHPIAEGAPDQLRAVGLIGQRQDRIRVRVVDERVRKERVQQCLHRRIRRAGVEEMRAELVDHLLVRERFQLAQLPQPGEVESGEPFRFDRIEIPTAALHAQSVDPVSEKVLPDDLDRGVASAVHDEIGLGADQARGVDAQRQRLAPARRVAVAVLPRIAVGPAVLHPARLDHDAGTFEEGQPGSQPPNVLENERSCP